MRPEQFADSRAGALLPLSGIGALTHAFVPALLPPSWEFPVRLWPLLVDARAALAALDGTGRHLPDPSIVLVPIRNREAQLSSRLEGTITDPQKQALFAVDPKLPASEGDPNNAYREIFNYSRALNVCLDKSRELPLSLRLIRELHSILMDGVRGSDRNPGNFRRSQNQVGRPARYVPPPVLQMGEALDNFEKYLHAPHPLDPLVESFIVHYQFEAIHPFGDGNGRVGRLLLAFTIAEWCKLSNQWLYMSAYFERHKEDYLNLLFRVSTHGDWASWIEFCLTGVIVQARDTENRCDSLVSLNRDFLARPKKGSVRLTNLINDLFRSPVITLNHVRERYGVTYPTADSYLKTLVSLGVIERVPGLPHKTYYSRPIFDITYKDSNE
jgi:Fic family protein